MSPEAGHLVSQRNVYCARHGRIVVRVNMPGWLTPNRSRSWSACHDRGIDPVRLIAMHEHRNDEIISWVPDGVVRHNDKATTYCSKHLTVMNAGGSF